MHSPCSQVTVLSQVSGNSSAFAFRQRDISRSTILVEKKLRTIVRYPPLSLSLSLIYRVMCNRIKRGEGGGIYFDSTSRGFSFFQTNNSWSSQSLPPTIHSEFF